MKIWLLRLQILYLALAIGFNLVSIGRMAQGLTPFTGSNLYIGMSLLTLFGVLIVVREKGYPRLSAAIMIPATMFMASSVYRHSAMAMQSDVAEHFAGSWSLLTAAGLNLFGSVMFAIGIAASFVHPEWWHKRG